jgi:hypothetical protein
VALNAETAFSELKNYLFKEKCKLLSEEQSKHLVVEQGSLGGMTPKGVKKRIDYYFHSQGNNTRIVAHTSFASDWVKYNFLSYFFVGLLFVFPLLIAFEYEASIAVKQHSLLGSLAEAFGFTQYLQAMVFVNLLKCVAVFSLVFIIISAIADVWIHKRKDAFAEESLRVLP